MSEADHPGAPMSAKPKRRGVKIAGGAVAVVALLGVGAVAYIRSPAGLELIATIADGAKAGPLGRIAVDGLRGDPFSNLRATRIALSDVNGEWLVVDNADVSLNTLALFFRTVEIKSVTAMKVSVLRRPVLTKSDDKKRDALVDIDLKTLSLPDIAIAEGVAGPAAHLRLEASLLLRRNNDNSARIDLRRTNADTDVLLVDWRQMHQGAVHLVAQGTGKAGGFFTGLLETPQGADLSLSAKAKGDEKSGVGDAVFLIGDKEAMRAKTDWRTGNLNFTAAGDLNATALTAPLARRLGGAFDVNLRLAPADKGLQNAVLNAEFANLNLNASGLINAETRKAPKGLDVVADTKSLAKLDKALDFGRGPAHAEGKLYAAGGGYAFKGRVEMVDIQKNGVTVQNAAGPLLVTMNSKAFGFQTAIGANGISAASKELAGLLGKNAQIDAAGQFLRKEAQIELDLVRVTSADAKVQVAGEIALDGPVRFEGNGEISNVASVRPDLKGRLNFRFGAAKLSRDDDLALSGQAAGVNIRGDDPMGRALGAAPKLQFAAVAPRDGGFVIERATLDGANLRAGAKGSMSRFETLNIDLEAAARGPLALGGLDLTGDMEAFGKIGGTRAAPRLTLQATAPGAIAGGVVLSDVVLEANIPDATKNLAGRALLSATARGERIDASSRFASKNARITLTDLQAKWNGGKVTGALTVGGGLPIDGRIDADGSVAPFADASGSVKASLRLSNQQGKQGIDLSADARDLSIEAAQTAFDKVSVRLQGATDAMNLTASARGWADRAFVIKATGPISLRDKAQRASLSIDGRYGSDVIGSKGPIEIAMSPQTFSANGALTMGAGSFDVDWRRKGDSLDAKLAMTKAPARLLGFLSPRFQLGGDMSGAVTLSGSRMALRGDGRIDLNNIGPDGAQGSGLNGALTFALLDGRIRANLDAKSDSGLVIKGAADVPASAAAQPFKIAFDPAAEASGELLVQGPAKDGWRVFGPTEQSLDGNVRLNVTLAGTIGNPELTGVGALSKGTFEDAATGIKLRDVAADLRFADSTLHIVSITAKDRRNGLVRAKGGITFGADGADANVAINMYDLQFLNRDEARATGSGSLLYRAIPGEAAILTGTVNADRVDFAPLNGQAPIVQAIPVTHINAASRFGRRNGTGPVRPGKPFEVDVTMNAPARVFVRGRGLDSEWSMNARLRGPLSKPILSGDANLIRGSFDLLSKRFDLESGQIKFNGDPMQAILNISGARAAADLTAYVNVTGTIAAPKIALSSSPSLPDDEVLARVLYDRGTTQLSALEAAQLASGLAALSGNQVFDLAGAFRTIGLDRVSFNGENGAASVSGGKYVAKNVYVEITGGAQGEPAAQVEWEPKRNLSLVSRFSGTQTSRFSVRWKKDY